MSGKERRSTKRVDSKLRFQAAFGGEDGALKRSSFETVNLSASGLYFKSDRPLEPMTRFELEIMIPEGAAGTAGGSMSVKCEGTVVWAEPCVDEPVNGRFEVGVFFSSLDPADRERLAAHVDQVGPSA